MALLVVGHGWVQLLYNWLGINLTVLTTFPTGFYIQPSKVFTMNTAMPSASTNPQPTEIAADRLISLAKQQENCNMSDSLQAIVGDILEALEADGIYQAGPAGLPCSILSTRELGRYLSIVSWQGTCWQGLEYTFVHVVTDMAMLSLLNALPEQSWRLYLNKQLRISLSYLDTVRAEAAGGGEELNVVLAEDGHHRFALGDYTDAVLRFGLFWSTMTRVPACLRECCSP